jgi:hypothetical protein
MARMGKSAVPSAPIVATVGRWLAMSAGLVLAIAAVVLGYLILMHRPTAADAFVLPIGLGAPLAAIVALALLRAEESRLARELRTTRTGTPVLRSLVARRRVEMPIFARWSSTGLGTAALLLADGDRAGALDAMAAEPMFARGGRLDALRAIVLADLERNAGTAAGLDRCIQRLREAPPTGNREADLYCVHVLVKAVLARGDSDMAAELSSRLATSGDADERVYATWLSVWFELDGPDHGDLALPAPCEGDLRMASLAARAHGAEKLVEKLSERLSAIAPQTP